MAQNKSSDSGAIVWLILAGVAWWGWSHNSDTQLSTGVNDSSFDHSITRQEAIDEHWDDIGDHLNGTEEVEACSLENGNCYTLSTDISSGHVEMVHFLNGGWLSMSAEIDESGSASDTDQEGRSWDLTLDMDSSLVDDAIQQWGQLQHYTIE